MAGLAKSDNKTIVLHISNKKDFITQFNKSIPSKEFMKSCKEIYQLKLKILEKEKNNEIMA